MRQNPDGKLAVSHRRFMPFPCKLCQYLAMMLTTLKSEIQELTHKAVVSISNDDDTSAKTMNRSKRSHMSAGVEIAQPSPEHTSAKQQMNSASAYAIQGEKSA